MSNKASTSTSAIDPKQGVRLRVRSAVLLALLAIGLMVALLLRIAREKEPAIEGAPSPVSQAHQLVASENKVSDSLAIPSLSPERNAAEVASGSLLSGSVIARESGERIPGALVCVAPSSTVSKIKGAVHSHTDDLGRFSLDMTKPLGRLVVRAQGFMPQLIDVDETTRELVIEMSRGLGVSGRVTDRTGTGIEGVLVSALGPTASGPYRMVRDFVSPMEPQPNQGSCATDALGRFQVLGLAPDRLRLRASKVGWRQVDPSSATFHGAANVLPVNAVVVEAGSSDVTVVMEPVWAFALRATDAVTGASIDLDKVQVTRRLTPQRASDRWKPVAGDDSDWFTGDSPFYWAIRGYFTQNDAPGDDSMACTVSSLGYNSVQVAAELRHPDHPGYLDPEIVQLNPVAKSGAIELTCTMGGVVYRDPLLIQVMGLDRGDLSFSTIESRDVGEQGQRVISLPAGRYRVEVVGIPRAPTLRADSIETVIAEGETRREQISLNAGVCEISVMSSSGCGLANAKVWVSRNGVVGAAWLLTATDSIGNIQRFGPGTPGLFRPLLGPGEYTISVDCWGFASRQEEKVKVVPGQSTRIELRLEVER